ncbi:fibroblast growth factor 7 [Lates japonicus]|uniref:Fibroblast growth factor 7 n=1 Tax=Lates japonicus TaxID=270547 RepID=A0AAD3NNE8_LATJO|nr:fibroblast growth factor 7 [Lates japonicus]
MRRHTRNYDYMEGGDVRIRRLFSHAQWFPLVMTEPISMGLKIPPTATDTYNENYPAFKGVFLENYFNATPRQSGLKWKKKCS